ncbi:endonuclease/exonuclease/phosphatase family protein [Flavobacteriaceae bacterium]|mgnify:CR=1 FL=1|jgi:endonuclease/exonuclease/phosphatase family metal-dependent hydrolase|nr:endonuclease/exonuclease/phosphatase family protein [Flavobacteriaceae bacterium]
MVKYNFLNKIIVLVNSILAILLLLSYLLPYISPEKVPIFTIISLAVPVLLALNIFFIIYWIIKLKKYFTISLISIILGIGYISNIYKFSEKKIFLNDDLKVMSYNVRLFNHYNWSTDSTIVKKISSFIAEKEPDVLSIQEYYDAENLQLKYPYQFIKTKSNFNKFGLAIFSKFNIINSGSLDLKESANNIIYTDILKDKDTIRVYNIHLESLKMNTSQENFGIINSDKLLEQMEASFQKQAKQVELFLQHEKKWDGKKILCGDFNNTAFSWVYRELSNEKQDAFKEAGKGLGKTFNYWYPLRIDFILTDANFDINNFKTFNVPYSDHYPILARLNLK